MAGPLGGRLLVAEPTMSDPNFRRTVVLVLEHTADGAAGVILNRPGDVAVEDVLPAWGPFAAPPAVVFVGGPVAQTAAVCLGARRDQPPPAGWQPVTGRLGVVDLDADAAAVGPHLEALRVFAGYSGWGAGQLEAELEQGAWFVCAAEDGDLLVVDPGALWRVVLRRQGGALARASLFPADPSMN